MSDATRSVEAEQALLGALMLDSGSIDRVEDVSVEHFSVCVHRQIYSAIIWLYENSKPTDIVSVFERLRETGHDVEMQYLNDLVSATPSSAGVARYAEVIRSKALERGLISAGSKIIEVATSALPTDEKIDTAQSEIESVTSKRARKVARHIGDIATESVKTVSGRSEGLESVIRTGISAIDRALCGGLRRGNLVIVAARPSVGKTAFAQTIGMYAAREHSVMMLSMEMSCREVGDRALAQIGSIPLDWIMSPDQNDDYWSRLVDASAFCGQLKFYVDDQSGLSIFDVKSKARAHKRRAGLDLLIVDYLQLMVGNRENRNAEIEEISRGLKTIAKELDVAVVALSQLSRRCEERNNKRPTLSDLRDSGAIEQDADIVMMLYAEERYNDAPEWSGIRELLIEKNRQGGVCSIPLMYIGNLTKFAQLQGDLPKRRGRRDDEYF